MIELQKHSFYNENQTKRELCDFIMKSNFLSMGDECKKFEKGFSLKQNRKSSVFVNSGSSANLVLFQALLNLGRLKVGDIVAVSALTWSTNIMPLIQLGLRPFLVDCEVNSLNVSSKNFQEALLIQPNIKAFFITNLLGYCSDLAVIEEICNNKNIMLFEDNCEALGSSADGKLLGNYGIASTFSFFVGHHLSTIEGGMICTDDMELSQQLIMCRAHGWDRNIDHSEQQILRKKHKVNDFYAKYTFYDLGFNVRSTDINGFIGNLQLNYWDEIVDKRHKNFIAINNVIEANDELISIECNNMEIVSSFAIPVIAKNKSILKKYTKLFNNSGVEIRPMVAGNMSKQPFYRKYISNPGVQKNADFVHNHSFYFGNHADLSTEEIEKLLSLLL
jgi:CDP-4-dehydro-6-deoxyglucose reductase, E1